MTLNFPIPALLIMVALLYTYRAYTNQVDIFIMVALLYTLKTSLPASMHCTVVNCLGLL